MQGPRKIVLTIDHLWPDGAQRQFVALAGGLQAAGLECVVCSLHTGGPLGEVVQGQGIRVREGGKRGRGDLFRMLRFLERVLAEERPDILQSFLFYSNNLCRWAGRRTGVPVVVTSQRCTPYRAFIPWPARAVQHLLLGLSHATVVNFPFPGGPRRRSPQVYIPNGVDTERFSPFAGRDAPAAPAGAPSRLLAAGRLEPQKGHDVLLDALHRLGDVEGRPVTLDIAGQGYLHAALAARARAHGLEGRVRFVGFRHDIEALYRRADVVVNPSRFEGMPNAVMEAMACGRPVVATSVGATASLLRDGVEGYLVPADDPEALAERIRWVLRHRERAEAAARAACTRIRRDFSVQRMTDRYRALYERLWPKRRR